MQPSLTLSKSRTAVRFVHDVFVICGAVWCENGRLDTVQQPEGVLGSYTYGLVADVLLWGMTRTFRLNG